MRWLEVALQDGGEVLLLQGADGGDLAMPVGLGGGQAQAE